MKTETINDLNANCWGYFPVPFRNSYGQKEKYPLCYFESFKIQALTFNKSLFKGISKSNAMYDLMDNGVIGKEIIAQLFWKFSLDDEKMILFSNKDTLLLREETENFVKIENTLTEDKNDLFFPDIAMSENFIFEWNDIKIPNCRLVYSPITNRNIIGVELANRFNFVLAYNEKTNNKIENNLYLQPRNNFQDFEDAPYCSDFGFDIEKEDNEFIIKRIEIGGLADKSGISVNDKIVGIDNGNFNLNDVSSLNSYLKDKKSVTLKIEAEGKSIEKELFLLSFI
jgi:hypothetical protein